MNIWNTSRETMDFTELCDRADYDPEALAECTRQINERKAEMRDAALRRKAAQRYVNGRYVERFE